MKRLLLFKCRWLSYSCSFPTNGSQELFTVMAIDPDVPSRNQSIYSQFLQWLVVNIPQEDMQRGWYSINHLPDSSGGRSTLIWNWMPFHDHYHFAIPFAKKPKMTFKNDYDWLLSCMDSISKTNWIHYQLSLIN